MNTVVVRGRVAQSCPAAVLLLGVVAALLYVGPALGGQGAGRVAAAFPAAGTLTIRAVRVRMRPDPRARVLRLMHQFRRDYRHQEVFAVASRVGSDGQPWDLISVPGRPNGRMGWSRLVGRAAADRREGRGPPPLAQDRPLPAGSASGARSSPSARAGWRHRSASTNATARFVPHKDPYPRRSRSRERLLDSSPQRPGGERLRHSWHPRAVAALGKAVSTRRCIAVSGRDRPKLRRYGRSARRSSSRTPSAGVALASGVRESPAHEPVGRLGRA